MKKREFQKKAAAALLGKLADVVMELEENPNITITSEYHSSYFKLRKNYNLIQISVKQTGELTYQLTDMLGNMFFTETTIPALTGLKFRAAFCSAAIFTVTWLTGVVIVTST